MGLFSKIFGLKIKEESKSHQLPSDVVCKEFGEVDIRKTSEATEVFFTILMEPQGTEAEGWQTGVALDASASMESTFGKELGKSLKGDIPDKLLKEYTKKSWLQVYKIQGNNVPVLTHEGKEDLVRQGYYEWTKNEVQPLARQMTSYLASSLDADGGTTVIYWACGADGKQIEVLGDLTDKDCEKAVFEGPKKVSFGNGTYLAPAVRYFVDRFKEAKRGMYIFITDGQLHDLDEVKKYTTQLAKQIEAGKHNSVKCVLIGIGDDINEDQMEELDDLETGTSVDIWDHKIAKEMRALIEIFAEVVSENTIVAPTATLYDDSGKEIVKFSDGLPAKVTFKMSPSSNAFELEVAGRRIRQTLLSRKSS
jgi:hypothetical protein